jgi:hypothetical protein
LYIPFPFTKEVTHNGQSRSPHSGLLPTPPLLITESRDAFKGLRDALNEELKPRGIIEQMYVEDFVYHFWEILRLRRAKPAIINLAFRAALKEVVRELSPDSMASDMMDEPEELARGWFSDPNVKKQITERLQEFNLDDTAIEAAAFKKSADNIEQVERLMASKEARRDKALVCIAQHRGDFGALLRDSSDRLPDGKVPEIEHDDSEERKEAA